MKTRVYFTANKRIIYQHDFADFPSIEAIKERAQMMLSLVQQKYPDVDEFTLKPPQQAPPPIP